METDTRGDGPAHNVTRRSRRPAEDTRRLLVEAAWPLMYGNGVARTTLRAVADKAGISLGNVYYHFPTRGTLIAAVLDRHKQDLHDVLTLWDTEADGPLAPLTRFIRAQVANSEKIAEQGCHHARLASELGQEKGFEGRSGEILDIYLAWATRKFEALGVDRPHDAAVELVARVQGGIALATTLRRPELLVAEMERTETWLSQEAARVDAPRVAEPWGTATHVC